MNDKLLDLGRWMSIGCALVVLALAGTWGQTPQTVIRVNAAAQAAAARAAQQAAPSSEENPQGDASNKGNDKTQKEQKEQAEAKARQTAHPWTGSPLGPEGGFEDPRRDQILQIERVMTALRIGRGSVVGDIGAGGGWFTLRAARRVAPTGIVYAQDILPKYTNFIAERARRENLSNVRTILGTTVDPKLPLNTMNAVLILNAYHEFEYPLTMLRKIHAAMKPGARLGFIERDDETLRRAAREAYAATGQIKRRVDERPDQNPYTDDHRLAREIVEREAALVGFRKLLTADLDLRGGYYLVVVERPR